MSEPRDDRHAPIGLRVDALSAQPGRRLVPAVGAYPRFSWLAPAPGVHSAAEIEVTTLGADSSVLSHVIDTAEPSAMLPAPLRSHRSYSWRVRLRDAAAQWGPWSASAQTETGPIDLDDWDAQWVSHPALSTLRVSLSLPAPARRARLHVAAQGLVRADLNGAAVNAASTDSTRTDFVRALYRTYDVGDLCQAGENTLDLTLAGGAWAHTGHDPRVLAELIVECADGSLHRTGTGAGLLAAPSEVTVHEPFYLERHEPAAASGAFGPTTALVVHTAAATPASPAQPPRVVAPDQTPPLHDMRAFTPVEVGRAGGARVYDVGVNIAGRSRLVLASGVARGLTLRVVHGEHLDADGRLDTTNLTMPYDHGRVRQALEYVTTGEAGQTCEAWFAYHGFRYIEVQGLPDEAVIHLTANSHHTDLGRTGRLTTDDERVNSLLERAPRTFLNNVHGIPEDCPTREQSGWTGDAASVAEFAFATFDLEAFYRKWLADLCTSQRPDGSIPAIAPDVRDEKVPSDPVWGAALHRILINHWHHYGDRRVVDQTLPAVRRWADFQLDCRDDAGVVARAPISYGSDWLGLEQTPPPVHHTAATIDCLDVLAELEEVAGAMDAAARRRAQADDLRRSARAAFFDPATGNVGNGSQGSFACAVQAGILTGDDAQRAARRIVDDVRERGNRVSSGFATTRTVTRALAEAGFSQALFDALQQPDEPGVGAMLDHGPGTFWECWWIDPTNTGTGSLDHVGLGGPFASWAWQFLAGVRPTGGGYESFTVHPRFVTGVERLDLEQETVRGAVRFSYRREGDQLCASLSVPPGSRAVVNLAGLDEHLAGPGDHEYTVAWPTLVASQPPAPVPAWQAPVIAAVPGDQPQRSTLLAEAIAAGRIDAGDARAEVLPDGIVCMPIPHAQQPGPVLRIVGDDDAEAAPLAHLDFTRAPLDLSDATFAFAMLDLCLPTTTRTVEATLVLHAADGSQVSATGRLWPAGWNRIAVDVQSWAGRHAVRAIDAGIVYGHPVEAAVSPAPPAFHLGEVGYSTLTRTW